MKHIPFPKIRQFKDVIKTIRRDHDFKGMSVEDKPLYEHTEPYPVIKFKGTVKLHGTNVGIVFDNKGNFLYTQSRNRVLSLEHDNAGFDVFIKSLNPLFLSWLYNSISWDKSVDFDRIVVYGEWCGQGVQKGVAISELEKMFVIFKVRYLFETEDGFSKAWMRSIDIKYAKMIGIPHVFNICEFAEYEISVDMNYPELSQKKLIDLTNSVEECCPVADYFGVKGIGEGIVWETVETPELLMFKVKGEKHSVTKVKTIAPIDTEQFEKMIGFVKATVTHNRTIQGFEFIYNQNLELEMKNIGVFLRWIVSDILDEESDSIKESGFDLKEVKRQITCKAKESYMEKIHKDIYG